MPLPLDHQAGPAGGEGPLAGQRRGHEFSRIPCPVPSPVVGGQDREPTIHRITEGDAMSLVPECKRIKKALRLPVRELQAPGVAAFGRLEDAGPIPSPTDSMYAVRSSKA
jgi:hypothetical protein